MFDRKHILDYILVAVLSAALTLTVVHFSAPGKGSDILEPAPAAEPAEDAAAEASGQSAADEPVDQYTFWEDPYLPARVYVNRDEDVQNEDWIYSQAGLVPAECSRIRELMAEVEAGTRSLENVSYPERTDDMPINVFEVDPGDFAGETYYVTLPSHKLKDYEMLYLLSCFEKLGIPFDPEELYSRNCMRGYCNDGTNRSLSRDEKERMDTFRYQIIRGMLKEEDIHPETECKSMATNFGPFTLYPYRRMTDDEVASAALARESAWEDDPDEVEKAARNFASGLFELPLSMELTEANRYLIPYTDQAEGYGLTFTIERTDAQGKTVQISDKPCSVYVYLRKRTDNGALVGDSARADYYADYDALFRRKESEALSQEKLLETGKKWIRENCLVPGLNSEANYHYDGDWGFHRIWADIDNYAIFAEMSQDGFVEYLSVQLVL